MFFLWLHDLMYISNDHSNDIWPFNMETTLLMNKLGEKASWAILAKLDDGI